MPNGTCSIDDCDSPELARGWCSKHYARWRRNGHPTTVPVRAVRLCAVDDCERKHRRNGWCQRHFNRWLRSGDTLGVNASPGEPLAWLVEFVRGERPEDCVVWPFARNLTGYGQVTYAGTQRGAHVVALIVSGDPRRGDLFALHSCDNPPCVNPAHLRWGTPVENTRDMIERGRRFSGQKF